MRIAIPLHGIEASKTEGLALRLSEQWRRAGHQPVIILGRHQRPGDTRRHDPAPASLEESAAPGGWDTIRMIWSLFQFLLVEEVDVIFCPGDCYKIVCVAMRVLLGERCPPVLVKMNGPGQDRDTPRPASALGTIWLGVQGRFLDSFIAGDDAMAGAAQRELGVDARRVRVIPDPAMAVPPRDRAARRRTSGAVSLEGASSLYLARLGELVAHARRRRCENRLVPLRIWEDRGV